MANDRTPLSRTDKEKVFRIAIAGFQKRFSEELAADMTDKALEEALKQALGIFGCSCGPNRLDVIYQGSGLKIWGSWEVINHVTTKPLFSGAGTIAMAREVYGIADPSEGQRVRWLCSDTSKPAGKSAGYLYRAKGMRQNRTPDNLCLKQVSHNYLI